MVPTRILIVDDDEAIRSVLAEIFKEEGYWVQVAGNGRQALQTLTAVPFDVLLTDISMPVMDGRELARALRERAISVPLVAMTASRNIVKTAREMRAAAYIEKPFDVDALLSTIDQVVHRD